MVFLAQTKTPEEWKGLATAISTLMDEATFEASAGGISFRGMDASHIALIDIFWPAAGFENYVCDSATKFGIRIDEFTKLLKRAEKKDSVQVSIGDDSMLHVKMVGGYNRSYKQRLIESSSSSQPLPKLNFNAKIVMPTALLDKTLSDVQVVSEYVNFACKDSGKLELAGRGDSGESVVTIEKGDENTLIDLKEESKATYSLDYIGKMVKALLEIEKTVIEYSTKMPIRLEFAKPSGMRIHFYLAPRVQD